MSVLIAAALVLAFSAILHEVAHGYVAKLYGDDTAERAGRLTLNPVPHIDPVGTILLPALLIFLRTGLIFAWAKPVPFNPANFRKRREGTFAVAVAGALTNLALAVFFGLGLRIYVMGGGHDPVFGGFFFLVTYINLVLAVFNLLPIPPLDGSRAVGVFLPPEARAAYFSLERWGFVILILLVFYGNLFGLVIRPLCDAFFGLLTGLSSRAFFG